MTIITEKISDLISDQMPDFVRADHPTFVSFVKAYYEWLEDSTEGATTYSSRKLLDYADIDSTTDEFLTYFKTKFLPYFPEEILADKAKLVKRIREFYQKKGSQESLKFLFRVLYGQDIELSYPKENILKASDGKWYIPQSFKLTVSNTSPTLDLTTLKKRRAVGSESSASCIIEGVYKTIDVDTNQEIFQIYVSNVNRRFTNGERLEVYYTANTGDVVYLFSEKIIGSLSRIVINPNNRGLRYRTGDPVVISGGLSTVDTQTLKASAVVNEVSSGQLQTIVVTKGGYGFRQFPNSAVTITAAEGGAGNGATAVISAIDTPLTTLFVGTDAINAFSSVTLSSLDYGFANFASSNINTELWRALGFQPISVGPIETITITNSGSGYNVVPTIDASSLYTANGFQQNLLSLGKIAFVEVISGGTGYKNTVDSIVVTGLGTGTNASFAFANNAQGTITSVTVLEGGEGYTTTDLAISTSTGSGAILKAYRYGEGDVLTATVDDIGRIQSFTLTNRGSGYVSTPNVSLRIKDIVISSVGETIGAITEGDYVYQGTSANAGGFTFYATVDSYDSANSIIRIYDYIGSLDVTANLKFDSFNVGVAGSSNNSVTTYGNGQARANAEFLDGLLKSNGYFLNTDGFLSADKKLQDSEKYHNFSYVVIAERALTDYKQALLDILHPSGMKLIGYNQLINTTDEVITPTSNVYTSNTSNNSGTVDASKFVYDILGEFKMLLHFDGAPAGANVIEYLPLDSTGNFTSVHPVNRNGAPTANVVSNTDIVQSGFGNSAYFAYNSYPLNSGSGLRFPIDDPEKFNIANSWTIDIWFYPRYNLADISGGQISMPIWYIANSSGSYYKLQVYASGGSQGLILVSQNGIDVGWTSIQNNGRVTGNSWNHAAVVHDRVKNRTRLYVNGFFAAQSAAIITSTNFAANTANVFFGTENNFSGPNLYAGYMDEFCIRSGIQYTADAVANSSTYTVPTAPFNHLQILSASSSQNGFVVTGNNTTFTRAKANDLIVIDSGNDSRKQVKRILSVANATSLNIESSTAYVGDGRLTTNSASSNVSVVSNSSSLSIQSGDYITYNISSNVYVSRVESISGTILTLNANPVSTNTGILYLVYPTFNDVSYEIISTD